MIFYYVHARLSFMDVLMSLSDSFEKLLINHVPPDNHDLVIVEPVNYFGDLKNSIDDYVDVVNDSGFYCDIIVPGCLDIGNVSYAEHFNANDKTYTCNKYTNSTLTEFNLYAIDKKLLCATNKKKIKITKADVLTLLNDRNFLHVESNDNNIMHHVVTMSPKLSMHYILFKESVMIIENNWKPLMNAGFSMYKLHDECIIYPIKQIIKEHSLSNSNYLYICSELMATEFKSHDWTDFEYIAFTPLELAKIISELPIMVQKID